MSVMPQPHTTLDDNKSVGCLDSLFAPQAGSDTGNPAGISSRLTFPVGIG